MMALRVKIAEYCCILVKSVVLLNFVKLGGFVFPHSTEFFNPKMVPICYLSLEEFLLNKNK